MDMVSSLYHDQLAQLVRSGVVPEEKVDEAVRRVLRVKYALGLFEHPYVDERRAQQPFPQPESLQLAGTIAERSFVLLRNAPGNGGKPLLPISKEVKKVALIGPLADHLSGPDGSSVQAAPKEVPSLLAELTRRLGEGNVLRVKGTEIRTSGDEEIAAAVSAARSVDLAVLTLVDQIYDGLLNNGVRPFLEISFMPKKLALRQDVHAFWYKQIVAPPKDYSKWDDLMRAFAQHLIERYGIDEVAEWYFEVWNEPNIDFWTGDPKEATYFELYDHTARALKAVSPRLRVGGPATSSAHWVDEFIAHVAAQNVPVDFISSHGYGDDTVEDLFGTHDQIPMDRRVCLAIKKVHDQVAASACPNLPLMWTEWNVPSFGPLNARDTEYVGAGLADDIRQCDGLVNMMSFWTFSDVFEEDGPKHEPFDGGFGLMAMGGIKKPIYSAFALLHKLEQERILQDSANVLVTRGEDGSLAVAAWNLVDPDQRGGARTVEFQISGVPPESAVRVSRADAEHGNTLAAYKSMGSPRYPTQAQVRELNRVAEKPSMENLRLSRGTITLSLPVNGIVLLEVPKK
jgi:xylan 1,4-beta-xylosidase